MTINFIAHWFLCTAAAAAAATVTSAVVGVVVVLSAFVIEHRFFEVESYKERNQTGTLGIWLGYITENGRRKTIKALHGNNAMFLSLLEQACKLYL